MTSTQLRAFVAVVRLGSVKQAAVELGVTESAISLHVRSLRQELGDALFTRTGSGLAFTPGGLRLASRASELLGLTDRTIREVSQAGQGGRLLRLATSTLFAEHAAPGLIELFASRANDLTVEMSVHRAVTFDELLHNRVVDAAIGPYVDHPSEGISTLPFLKYRVMPVVSSSHPLAGRSPDIAELRQQMWLLGPAATGRLGIVPGVVRRVGVPESHQQIFQSQEAAVAQAKRGRGVALVVAFAAASDIEAGDLVRVPGDAYEAVGSWGIRTLAGSAAPAAAAELARFVVTPRAIQAMLRGSGVTVGRFRPAIHITLWS